jgi:hypothetical protein
VSTGWNFDSIQDAALVHKQSWFINIIPIVYDTLYLYLDGVIQQTELRSTILYGLNNDEFRSLGASLAMISRLPKLGVAKVSPRWRLKTWATIRNHVIVMLVMIPNNLQLWITPYMICSYGLMTYYKHENWSRLWYPECSHPKNKHNVLFWNVLNKQVLSCYWPIPKMSFKLCWSSSQNILEIMVLSLWL